ncbi:hypothetical protein BRC89_07925 [Halobacteriales archaeon QS_4_70_19]|nr:MAG: hypothetical protein BRC89_07925 [Halobacteriales archaeon QS_4_70_19]
MADPDDADYYTVLGVDRDASVADIRAAYRDRVKETHPDRNDAPDAAEQFQRVRRAEAVLTDADERARYDRLGHEAYVDDGASDGATATAGAATDGGAAGHAHGRSRTRSRRRARWTAEGWAGPDGDTPGADGSGTDARAASGTAGTAADRNAHAADLGDRITLLARALERYRFDLNPKTAMFGMATFLLYPVFLASSFTPKFPLVVNVILLCCLFCTVGYLLAAPEVGVPVFGAWSLFGPVVFLFVDQPLLSWAGFFLVASTFVPFGLSIGILEVLRTE